MLDMNGNNPKKVDGIRNLVYFGDGLATVDRYTKLIKIKYD